MKKIEAVLYLILYLLKKSSEQNNSNYFSDYYKKLLKCYNDKNNDKISQKIYKALKDNDPNAIIYINDYLDILFNYDLARDNKSKIVINEIILKDFIIKKHHDELIRSYLYNLKDFRVAVVFSDKKKILKSVNENFKSINVKIISERNFKLSNIGRKNIIRLLYAHETHWNEKNLDYFVKRVKNSVSFIFFEYDKSKINIRALKESLREKLIDKNIIQKNNNSHHIHFSDTLMESRWISNSIFNSNSNEFLNSFIDKKFKKFNYLIKYVNKELSIREDRALLILDSGMAMSLHCLRDTNDIDFITLPNLVKNITHRLMENHNEYYLKLNIDFKEYFYDPTFFCNYKNLNFLSLNGLLNIKKKRFQKTKSIKDYNDTLMIKDKISKISSISKSISSNIHYQKKTSNKLILFLSRIRHLLRKKLFNINRYNIKEERFILDQ